MDFWIKALQVLALIGLSALLYAVLRLTRTGPEIYERDRAPFDFDPDDDYQ